MDSVEVAFWKRGAAVKCVVQMHLHTKMMLALQKKKKKKQHMDDNTKEDLDECTRLLLLLPQVFGQACRLR